jgi:hypothetical protein
MEGVQMSNNTKHSEETYIRWSVNMNSAIEVGQIEPEPILTIHPDGRVTTSPRLKPDEISALVLDQIKTAWLKDAQATKIRELESEIEEKRKDVVWLATEKAKLENYVMLLEEAGDELVGTADAMDAWRKAKEAKP